MVGIIFCVAFNVTSAIIARWQKPIEPEFWISCFAGLISLFALWQTRNHKVIELRPWISLHKMNTQREKDNSSTIVGVVRHFGGGPALNIRFSTSFDGKSNGWSERTHALFPSLELTVQESNKGRKDVSDGDKVEWYFEFEDVHGRKYQLKQVVSMYRDNLQQHVYAPSAYRGWENLWGAI